MLWRSAVSRGDRPPAFFAWKRRSRPIPALGAQIVVVRMILCLMMMIAVGVYVILTIVMVVAVPTMTVRVIILSGARRSPD